MPTSRIALIALKIIYLNTEHTSTLCTIHLHTTTSGKKRIFQIPCRYFVKNGPCTIAHTVTHTSKPSYNKKLKFPNNRFAFYQSSDSSYNPEHTILNQSNNMKCLFQNNSSYLQISWNKLKNTEKSLRFKS